MPIYLSYNDHENDILGHMALRAPVLPRKAIPLQSSTYHSYPSYRPLEGVLGRHRAFRTRTDNAITLPHVISRPAATP